VPRGGAQEDHREVVTPVARKGNVLAHRRFHPHREQEGAAAVVGAACRKSGAHPARASSRAEDRNEYDRAPVESWAAYWSKRMSTNMRMMQSRGMARAQVEKGSVVRGQRDTGEESLAPDASARRTVHVSCVQ
jgi:hypothetical protein